MSKIASLKLANSVKCGPTEEVFLTSKAYDMTLDGITIRIAYRKEPTKVVNTTLMNTVWFILDHEADVVEKKQGTTMAPKAGPAPRKGEAVL